MWFAPSRLTLPSFPSTRFWPQCRSNQTNTRRIRGAIRERHLDGAHIISLNDAALPEQARAAVWTRREGFRFIELEDDGRELFDFYRAQGAARQVAAELCAQDKRRTLDAIATIYKNDTASYGLDIWNVSLEFSGYTADLGNVEGWNYAQSETAQELALMVVGDMEATGYTITGKPNLSAQRLAYGQERFKNNVCTQNWQ